MGIAESTPSSEVEEVVELYDDDPTYPWLPIIEYVADRLPNNFVRTYDFEAIREIVLEASIIPFDINKMTNKTIPKELDHDEIEFASAILQKDKKLKKYYHLGYQNESLNKTTKDKKNNDITYKVVIIISSLLFVTLLFGSLFYAIKYRNENRNKNTENKTPLVQAIKSQNETELLIPKRDYQEI